MGKKKKEPLRVVLDTNVLVSALLFRGELSGVVELWKNGRISPLLSRETFGEFRRVLEYPKFALKKKEIKAILAEEILPYFEVVEITEKAEGVCRDPEDDKFISCALSGRADFIVSGDADLCGLGGYRSVRIIRVPDLLKMFA